MHQDQVDGGLSTVGTVEQHRAISRLESLFRGGTMWYSGQVTPIVCVSKVSHVTG